MTASSNETSDLLRSVLKVWSILSSLDCLLSETLNANDKLIPFEETQDCGFSRAKNSLPKGYVNCNAII